MALSKSRAFSALGLVGLLGGVGWSTAPDAVAQERTVFSDWVLEPETRMFFGWQMIAIIQLHMFYQVYFLVKGLYRLMRMVVIRYWRVLRKKCQKIPEPKSESVDEVVPSRTASDQFYENSGNRV